MSSSLWAELPPQSFHFVPHLSLFTLASLTTLLAAAGLRVIAKREDRELQVLAVRDPAARPVAAPADFAARAGTWATAPFGDDGRRQLSWRKARRSDAIYDLETRATRRLPSLRGDKPWRALGIQVSGPPEAPVNVRHEVAGAPVWIK